MGEQIELDASATVTTDEIASRIGDELIIEKGSPYGYLSALALETMDEPSYDVTDTLVEFIDNCTEYENLDSDDVEWIEAILRDDE